MNSEVGVAMTKEKVSISEVTEEVGVEEASIRLVDSRIVL